MDIKEPLSDVVARYLARKPKLKVNEYLTRLICDAGIEVTEGDISIAYDEYDVVMDGGIELWVVPAERVGYVFKLDNITLGDIVKDNLGLSAETDLGIPKSRIQRRVSPNLKVVPVKSPEGELEGWGIEIISDDIVQIIKSEFVKGYLGHEYSFHVGGGPEGGWLLTVGETTRMLDLFDVVALARYFMSRPGYWGGVDWLNLLRGELEVGEGMVYS